MKKPSIWSVLRLSAILTFCPPSLEATPVFLRALPMAIGVWLCCTPTSADWVQRVGGNRLDSGYDIAGDGSGAFVFVGESKSYGINTKPHILLGMIDSAGKNVWTEALLSLQEEKGLGVALGPDRMIGVTGYSAGGSAAKPAALLLDRTGGVRWTKRLEVPDSGIGYDIAFSAQGDLFIVGDSTASEEALFILKLDATGSQGWAYLLGGLSESHGRRLFMASDDAFFVVGSGRKEGGDEDFLLVKIYMNGTIAWGVMVDINPEEEGAGVVATAEGGCIMTGWTHNGTSNLTEAVVVKVDAAGVPLFIHTVHVVDNVFNRTLSCASYAIEMGVGGAIFITGYATSGTSSRLQLFVAELDSAGNTTRVKLSEEGERLVGRGIALVGETDLLITGLYEEVGVDLLVSKVGIAAAEGCTFEGSPVVVDRMTAAWSYVSLHTGNLAITPSSFGVVPFQVKGDRKPVCGPTLPPTYEPTLEPTRVPSSHVPTTGMPTKSPVVPTPQPTDRPTYLYVDYRDRPYPAFLERPENTAYCFVIPAVSILLLVAVGVLMREAYIRWQRYRAYKRGPMTILVF